MGAARASGLTVREALKHVPEADRRRTLGARVPVRASMIAQS
jgi:hypothetical protein